MRSKGGFDKFKFEIIEECGEYNKLELEKMYIEMYNPELNTLKYNFDMKEYRENNKEKLKEYSKEYCENNKEKIAEYKKEYCEKNKDKIRKRNKEYREKNKEKIKEYRKEIICCRVCRCEITKVNFKKHCKSKNHIANQTNK
jgi:DNA repair exonuclease SbcCD ATPase subunit